MLAEPRWFYDENRITNENTMVINLINITSDNLIAKEGIGTVRMKLVGDPYYNYTSDITGDIIVEYTPGPGQDYSIAWDNYIMKIPRISRDPGTPPGQGTSITYTIKEINTLVIKIYEVKIESI